MRRFRVAGMDRWGWAICWALSVVGGFIATGQVARGEPGVAFSTIRRGALSGVREPIWTVARTQEEWTTLWHRHAGAAAVPPFVDFSSQIVVAVFAGQRPSAGYEIEVMEVRLMDRALRVMYRERTPPATGLVRPVLTAPFHIIQLPRSDLPVEAVQQR